MDKIKLCVWALVGLTQIGLICGVSCQGKRLDMQKAQIADRDNQIKALQDQIETTNAQMIRMKTDIESASRRIDQAITTMTKGTKDAQDRHETRMEGITKLDAREDIHDWLCEPVPDDVCMLFKGYADMPE